MRAPRRPPSPSLAARVAASLARVAASLASGAASLALLTALGAPAFAARAQTPMPFVERAPSVEGPLLITVALGVATDAHGPLAARRLAARTAARARALAALHRFVDDALASVPASPRALGELHAALDARADVRRVRSLVDGSALVELAVPRAALREALDAEGLPW